MKKIGTFDFFMLVNGLLFVLMCVFVYYDRFVHELKMVNTLEFFFYASVIFAVISVTWYLFRSVRVSIPILVMVEIGVLIHFAGAFVHLDGHRLYDIRFFHIRYDKYVHFANAVIATFVTIYIFVQRGFEMTKFMLLVAVLVVLGLGAVNEIIEFIATLTLPHTGVGAYRNNMSDLCANLVGSVTAAVVFARWLKHRLISPSSTARASK